MASTNFLQFDEAGQNMMSDGDYEAHAQRARGVTPGIAYPNLHNKLYYQVSTMCKAFADFMVQQGQDAQDGDIEQLTTNIANAINRAIEQSNRYVPLAGGTMTGLLSLFTGSTVPTPGSDDNSKKIPNTEWVQTWIKAYVAELSENLEVQWSSKTFTVPALGITGLMAPNGYISLGKLFGGLILQWGIISTKANANTPIIFQVNFKLNYIILALHSGSSPLLIAEEYTGHTLSSTRIIAKNAQGVANANWSIYWFTIGY